MDQQDNQRNEALTDTGRLRELREFDFEDILTDDIPAENEHPAPEAPLPQADEAVSEEAISQDSAEKKKKKKKKSPLMTDEEYAIARKRKNRYIRGRVWKILTGMLVWIKDIAIAVAVVWVIQMFVAGYIKVDNTAMEPTIRSGETVVYSRFSYKFAEPGRGEIIAFTIGSNTRPHMSRIIGLPGDIVNIDEQGNISVNGKPLVTPYSEGITTFIPGQVTYPFTVPEDSYFILCDHQNATLDSRFLSVGAVPKSNIVGKVFFCVWPRGSWRPIVQGLIHPEE